MRTMIAALGLMVAAGAALAETEAPTPAPVPGYVSDRGAPADRAGHAGGTERDAPFSGLPSSSVSTGLGQATPIDPGNPQRDTAPAPSLSR